MSLSFIFDLAQFDFAQVHQWLAATYWSPGISREKVEKGFRASTLCVAAFAEDHMAGVARCISDTTRFAYVADVYVAAEYRKRGIAREMVRRLMEHPKLKNVESWYLLTEDAQGVYTGLGFKQFPYPERFMVCRPAE